MAPKAKPKKQNWEALRELYTWHLRPPFDKEFDCSHWWTGLPDSKIEPIAALYELVRRHPIVGWAQELPDKSIFGLRTPIAWALIVGLKPWPRLSALKQHGWRLCAGNLKGLDFRDASERCFSIERDVLSHMGLKRLFAQKRKYNRMTCGKACHLVEKDMVRDPPHAKDIEAAIARRAVEAHRRGYVLLAVAPDLAAGKAESLLSEEYHEHLKSHHLAKTARRVRWRDWLPLISAFEDAELKQGGGKSSQSFARYRRVVDGVRFT